ncbi:arogenate dehydrogenase 1, chloroplastic isoform X1 [Coffea arabica]|uniref:Arogenate dehydrogenase 1, chloroplastic isoform X1 n=1 Tax=Coffea arabica TaxID=13443 RepID=A0ABM4WDK0_COFAR
MSSPTSSAPLRALKIGIIGFGPFAQFLTQTMIKQGHSIRATSRSDYSEHCARLGIPFIRDMDEFLQSDNEVVLLCTSILSLSDVVESMPFQCLKQPTLFADVLSVKEYPRDVLLQALPPESDLICTHPMFGPESGRDGWHGLTLMYEKVRIRNEAVCSGFLHIFASELIIAQGCKMLEMTCEEHDKLAAKSQFLTHTIGRVLAEMQIEPTPIDTKGFEKLFEVKESVANDSFDLFNGLYVHNRFARQQLKNFEVAFDGVKHKLLDRMNE